MTYTKAVCVTGKQCASPSEAVRVVAILAVGVIFDQTAQDVDVRQSANLWPQSRVNCRLRAADRSIASVIVSAIISIFLYITVSGERVAPRRTSTTIQGQSQKESTQSNCAVGPISKISR